MVSGVRLDFRPVVLRPLPPLGLLLPLRAIVLVSVGILVRKLVWANP